MKFIIQVRSQPQDPFHQFPTALGYHSMIRVTSILLSCSSEIEYNEESRMGLEFVVTIKSQNSSRTHTQWMSTEIL